MTLHFGRLRFIDASLQFLYQKVSSLKVMCIGFCFDWMILWFWHVFFWISRDRWNLFFHLWLVENWHFDFPQKASVSVEAERELAKKFPRPWLKIQYYSRLPVAPVMNLKRDCAWLRIRSSLFYSFVVRTSRNITKSEFLCFRFSSLFRTKCCFSLFWGRHRFSQSISLSLLTT